MINIEWTEGAPETLEIGMVIRKDGGEPFIIGHDSITYARGNITHWAWLIKPYQLSWIDSKMGVPKR